MLSQRADVRNNIEKKVTRNKSTLGYRAARSLGDNEGVMYDMRNVWVYEMKTLNTWEKASLFEG